MKIGTSNINQMYIGGSQVSAAYLGWEQVFPETQPSPTGDTKVIMYRSTDEQTITPRFIYAFNFHSFDMEIVSNTYDLQNGGVMVFSDNVTNIPSESFSGYNLTEIVIPQSVTIINSKAFSGCTYLSSVTLPENVYLAQCFEGCTALSSITIPDNTVLGGYIFAGCTSLSSVTFGSGITLSADDGGNGMFVECSSLQSFVIPSFFDKVPNYMFDGCINLSSVTIPNSVTAIGRGAFASCSGLSSITIPSSVINIDQYAFLICSNLSTINYSGTMSQWSLITLGNHWNQAVPATVVHCSDGDVSL